MPADLVNDRANTVNPGSASNSAVAAGIRAELAERFTWPPELLTLSAPLHDLSTVMDVGKLANLAAAFSHDKELSFTIISKEYIQTGLNWIHGMRHAGFGNFLVLAGDRFTAEMLDERSIPNVLTQIDESEFDPSFVSTTGFSAKGLAVSAFKFPVARFLVASGYNVVLSDADAMWLRDPMPNLRGTAVAFQRIAYHPRSITKLWGFAACGGFNSFRDEIGTLNFLDRCIEENQTIFCDQIAMNLALLDGEPAWRCDHPDWRLPDPNLPQDMSRQEAGFAKCVTSPIQGTLRNGMKVLALPHDKFWRHALFDTPREDMVICHPNSPKDDHEKMVLLTAMGLRFEPSAASR